MAEEWGDHPYQVGQMVAVGNVARAGLSTPPWVAFLEIGGYGDLEFYGQDNVAVDQKGAPLPMVGRYTTSSAKIIVDAKPPLWPDGLTAMPHPMSNAMSSTMPARGLGTGIMTTCG